MHLAYDNAWFSRPDDVTSYHHLVQVMTGPSLHVPDAHVYVSLCSFWPNILGLLCSSSGEIYGMPACATLKFFETVCGVRVQASSDQQKHANVTQELNMHIRALSMELERERTRLQDTHSELDKEKRSAKDLQDLVRRLSCQASFSPASPSPLPSPLSSPRHASRAQYVNACALSPPPHCNTNSYGRSASVGPPHRAPPAQHIQHHLGHAHHQQQPACASGMMPVNINAPTPTPATWSAPVLRPPRTMSQTAAHVQPQLLSFDHIQSEWQVLQSSVRTVQGMYGQVS